MYTYTNGKITKKATMEKPFIDDFRGTPEAGGGYRIPDWDAFDKAKKEYDEHLASLPSYLVLPPHSFVEGQDVKESEVEIGIRCPCCGGDGKETCDNPDHEFISAIGGETGRLGCPGCGHDPDHKTGAGRKGAPCFVCDGKGLVTDDQFNEYCNSSTHDDEPITVVRQVRAGEEVKEADVFYRVISDRINYFSNHHHKYEAKELHDALNVIMRLVPPDNFKSLPQPPGK